MKKKMIAPIVIGVVVGGLSLCYALFLLSMGDENIMACAIAIPFIALAGAMAYVSYERIKEIKGGEEDDLSKY